MLAISGTARLFKAMSSDAIENEEIYRLEEQVGFLLRVASQRHATIFQANIINGLTPTQFSSLIRIAEYGSISQNRLGRLAAMDVATIKGVIDRLRTKELVTTSPDPNDKRRSLISLTKEGEALIDELKTIGATITKQSLAPLTASEQRNLVKLLHKIS